MIIGDGVTAGSCTDANVCVKIESSIGSEPQSRNGHEQKRYSKRNLLWQHNFRVIAGPSVELAPRSWFNGPRDQSVVIRIT